MNLLRPSPGTEWLADALRWALADPSSRGRAPGPPEDWAVVGAAIRRHRVVGTLAPHLEALGAPADAIDRLRTIHRRHAHHALRVAADSIDVATMLQAAGVPALLLKGPALAAQQDRSMADRGAGDVDLWVDPADVDAAEWTLRQHGHRRARSPIPELTVVDGWRLRLRNWLIQERTLQRDDHCDVDLHWRAVANQRVLGFDFAEAFERSVPAAELAPARTLAPSDALAVVAAHANQDAWFVMRHLVDVATLARVLDPAAVRAAARDDQSLTLALTVAGRLAPDVATLARPSARVRRRAQLAWRICRSEVERTVTSTGVPPRGSRWIMAAWRVLSVPTLRDAVQPAVAFAVPMRLVIRPARLRRALVRTWCATCCTVELAVTSLRMSRLRNDQLLQRLGDPQPVASELRRAEDPLSSAELADVRRGRLVGRAVARASERLPWHPTCLRQSLTVRRLLRRTGTPNVVLVGVADAATMDAHAWVTVHGRVVAGGQQREFQPVAAFPADQV